MVAISIISAVTIVAASVNAAPTLHRRIAQTIADSTTKWVAACEKAGGGSQCNTVSQTAFMTLLAAAGNCDQQNAADQMVDLAKQLNNDPDMITQAQIFVQQPRNAPDSLQVPYCQTPPKNAELNGLFHCQFQGTVKNGFSGDQTGNLPLGVSVVNPPGSCPALNTPVADGQQLSDIVNSPGSPIGGSSGATSASSNSPSNSTSGGSSASHSSAPATSSSTGAEASSGVNNASAGSSSDQSSSQGSSSSAGAAASDPSKPFLLSNGQEAQKLNAQFATAQAGDSCQEGSQACVGGNFAQCVGGQLQVASSCSGGTSCFALPLVNKAGTSVTCDTEADAAARIAATGATGGITGSA